MAPAPAGVSDLARYDQLGSLPAGGPASKAGRLTQSPLAKTLLTWKYDRCHIFTDFISLMVGKGLSAPDLRTAMNAPH